MAGAGDAGAECAVPAVSPPAARTRAWSRLVTGTVSCPPPLYCELQQVYTEHLRTVHAVESGLEWLLGRAAAQERVLPWPALHPALQPALLGQHSAVQHSLPPRWDTC